MNIKTINDAIKDLESANTTVNNVQELSALYIVRKHLIQDRVEEELNDILPAYKNYIDIKKRYQMHQTSQESIILSMESVCRELKDFVATLYSCTDCEAEREQIKDTISELERTL